LFAIFASRHRAAATAMGRTRGSFSSRTVTLRDRSAVLSMNGVDRWGGSRVALVKALRLVCDCGARFCTAPGWRLVRSRLAGSRPWGALPGRAFGRCHWGPQELNLLLRQLRCLRPLRASPSADANGAFAAAADRDA